MLALTLPNILSLSRLVFALPTAYALSRNWILSAGLYFIVLATDMSDGWLARRRGSASAVGTLLDHGSDAAFVIVLLATGVWLGYLPVILPVLISLAFLQYVFDARHGATWQIRPSRLGRINGIAYFVLVGVLIGVHLWAAHPLIHTILNVFGWLLSAATFVSMLERARYNLRRSHDR